MQKKQSKKEEVDGKGLVETIRRTRRVAMSWNQELKESALPDLKAHVDVLNGESVSSKQLFFLCFQGDVDKSLKLRQMKEGCVFSS